MKNIEEQIKVMQHYANGGKVENKRNGIWYNCEYPVWNWNTDYRIKEEKKTITIEKWLCTNDFGDYFIVKLGKNNIGTLSKIKLLESYEVEL